MSERPGRRDQIDRFTRTMINDGVDPRRAAEKSRELAIRADRREQRENPRVRQKKRAADEMRERRERAARDG